MQVIKPEQLIERIEGNQIDPVYFFSGDETFLKEEALRSLVKHAIEPGTEAFCSDVFHGDDCDAAAILSVASMVPMMSNRRIVIVRDFQKLSQKDKETVVEYAESPAASTVMVIEASRVNLKSKIYERLSGNAISVVYYPLFPERIPTWLQRHAKMFGKRLTTEAAHQLQDIVGTDLQELSQEVEKLAVFVGQRDAIELEDVDNTLGPVRAGSVFDIAEAVGEKKLSKALGAYQRALDAGDEPQAIVALFVRHFVILWKIRFLKKDRRSDEVIKKTLQMGWGFNRFYSRYAAQSRLLDDRNLQGSFESLYEADIALKTSTLSPELVMHRLLYELCVARAA